MARERTLVCGIDVGSLSTKAVVLDDGQIFASAIELTLPDSEASANLVLKNIFRKTDICIYDFRYIVGTGYGRVNIPFANKTITEITCHARGAHALHEKVRTILDIGGQDCKAIRCDHVGRVVNFAMNDKCAAGTGRFLERIAAAVNSPLDQIGELSLQGVNKSLAISSTCAVFAESDILKMIRNDEKVNDILAGAFDALIKRLLSLLGRVGVEEELCISGGVGKNIGIVKRLEKKLRTNIFLPPDPQLVGAYGAALIAFDQACKLTPQK